ncbi:MAG: PA0069 family radical SAM protein [Betaproteobacteria bacterium]|nr:PA0069 family radical SAM protein [Betaproteobacteria bacterium]
MAMDDLFEPAPDSRPPPRPRKGRGAAGNVEHRFTTWSRQAEDDGWWQDETPPAATRLSVDTARSILAWNESPDLGFDRSLNPYRGCEHGCIYCYARPTHAWLGLSPGLDFETRLFWKPDAVARLKAELAAPGYACRPIALGTATDAYQPVERQQRLTRDVLEALLALEHPVTLVTKSALVARDVGLWATLAARRLAAVALSVTSLDNELSRRLEPRAAAPAARLRALRTLADTGVPAGVLVAPIIPALNDHQLEQVLEAARDHGARYAGYTLLRLPHEVAGLFGQWLDHHAPEKAARLMAVLYDLRGGRANDTTFGRRMTGLGHYADLIRQRFELACRRLGLATTWPELDCTRFRPPRAEGDPGGQMSLF